MGSSCCSDQEQTNEDWSFVYSVTVLVKKSLIECSFVLSIVYFSYEQNENV